VPNPSPPSPGVEELKEDENIAPRGRLENTPAQEASSTASLPKSPVSRPTPEESSSPSSASTSSSISRSLTQHEMETIESVKKKLARGDIASAHEMVKGFAYSCSGYKKSPRLAREINDLLVQLDDLEAIARKIGGLTGVQAFNHWWGYEPDLEAAQEFDTYWQVMKEIHSKRKDRSSS